MINDHIKKVYNKFRITIMTLAAGSVLLMGFVLYEANVISFSNDLSSEDLAAAVEDHPEVKKYLESEHQNEAHFIKIANIIKTDQQQDLGRTMLLATIPVVILATALGSLAARRLLKPVEEAYDAQERFIADAAHELRNPLATMSAVIQNAKRSQDSLSKEDFAKYNKQMERQLKRMVRINEDLLYLERNIDTTQQSPHNVSELLHDVIEDLQPQATRQNIAFKLDIEEGLETTMAQREFVRMAKNIIENALKYSKPTSKQVAVSLKRNKSQLELTVKDSGIGIPEADQANISERFFRASNASKHEGTGLGLAIVQKILDNYGGKLEIISKSGRGTTVIVRF